MQERRLVDRAREIERSGEASSTAAARGAWQRCASLPRLVLTTWRKLQAALNIQE